MLLSQFIPSSPSHGYRNCGTYIQWILTHTKRMPMSPNEVDEPRAYVQSEVSQKEKDQYCTLTHRYRI